MEVIVGGVRYVPEASKKIGIAITTHNRPKLLDKAFEHHMVRLPPGAVVVVVDDGSSTPVTVPNGVRLIRHKEPKGIAAAKNACIAALMDAGCEHLFLFDDDVWPTKDGWWEPYVASPEPHLMMLWGDKYFETADLVAFPWPKGCMLYAERRVIDRIGGMNLAFGRWGCEHMEWSDRIHNAGLTTCRYQDIPGALDRFHACDWSGEVKSSVPDSIRALANTQAAIDGHYADNWLPYRGEQAMSNRIALSVLVPSISSRRASFASKIADELYGQQEALSPADRQRVEILMLTDSKSIVLGDKRNQMIRIAQGDYIVFVDDDDRLEPDYLATLLKATESGDDCITFNASVSINGQPAKICRYSTKYAKDENTATEYHRLPNHITAVKREIALRSPFPSKLCGEDADYAVMLRPLLKTEHNIDRVLYHYDYNDRTTETQRKPQLEVGRAPLVDVVILSKATTPQLRDMAQKAIDTCLATCGKHTVGIVVMEQVSGVRYRDAVTIYEPGEFNYNKFANKGARFGNAKWIMVANSDLEFQENWLDELLAANHPIVSPVDPNHQVQRTIRKNETGAVNGRNLSGWCFMIARKLWDRIGGFDEDFAFWCADDSLIEQVKAVGSLPMIVPGAQVLHLESKTIGNATKADGRDDGAMTWAQVFRFERKYGVQKFAGDARYTKWKQRYATP